jgi:hypothetical protein
MHGAQLLYNLILAEKRSWQEQIDQYRGDLDGWWRLVCERDNALRTWDRKAFWKLVLRSNPRVSVKAQRFVNGWIDLVLGASEQTAIVDGAASRQRVEHREIQLKGGLARVRNERARELWNGAAGAAQLDLRWASARRIIADILAGLEEGVDA